MSPWTTRRRLLQAIAALSAATGCSARSSEGTDDGRSVSIAWKADLSDASVPVPGEFLYLGTQTGTVGTDHAHVLALDPDDGEDVWNVRTNDGTTRPTVAGGTVYAGTSRGRIHALEAATGQGRWSYQFGGEFPTEWPVGVQARPVVVDGTLVATATSYADGTPDRQVAVGLDPATGEPLWRHELPGAVTTPPVVDGTAAYLADEGGRLLALDSGGERRWVRSFDGPLYGLTVHRGTLYVGCGDEHLYALDPATGDRRWRVEAKNAVDALAVRDGTVYAGSDDYRVQAVEAASGDRLWRTELGNVVTSVAPVGDGLLVLTGGSRDGIVTGPTRLSELDAGTGERRRRVGLNDKAGWVARVDGAVYLGREFDLWRLAEGWSADA